MRDPRFRMRVVTGMPEGDPIGDAVISWVHSSDLRDPTPWLEPGQLLLTDGAQFSEAAPGPTGEGDGFADAYVGRLQQRGVLALGYATGIVDDDIPQPLVDACAAHGFPLIEVDARTPFIGIIRHVADVIADDRRARLEWSIDAQRAIARAALRPAGLPAILLELSRRLDCWVALFDVARHQVAAPGLRPIPAELGRDVARAVDELLTRGLRAGRRVGEPEVDRGMTLQTIGQGGQLLGVLVVGTSSPLDPAGTDLVGSVIGLASVALEERRTLDGARRRLRTGLAELLLAGAVDVADRAAALLWGPLPGEPFRVSVVAGEVAGESVLDELELLADGGEGELFFAERAGEILVLSRGTQNLETLLARHALGAGRSSPVGWSDLGRGLEEARRAAGAVSREHPFVSFGELTVGGLQRLLAASGGRSVAVRMLEPLDAVPPATREQWLQALRVWLRRHGGWETAARELGVHRHTLRSRVDAAAEVLGIDLDDVDARAELWAALRLTE